LLNIPIADDKTEGPTTVLCFLGLELDSQKMEVRMPRDKILDIVCRIEHVLEKEKVTLKVMQSLIGVLNFACRVIYPGRPFCRRLINSTCGLTKPYHHLRVTKAIKADLNMWLDFFSNYNGVSVFHDRFWVSNADCELYTDAAGALGFGCYFRGRWCAAAWPQEWLASDVSVDITVLELFPIVVAIDIWGSLLLNKKIKFNCDNQAVVHIINSMTSRSDKVMVLVRMLTVLCLKYNMVLQAAHVPGVCNAICDSLSRFQFRRFRELAPDAEMQPDPVPPHLWNAFKAEYQNC
jgi:hypothetical protein